MSERKAPEMVRSPIKGDIMLGFSPSGALPLDWVALSPTLAYKRYDGLMLDHIPFVLYFRNAEVVGLDLDLSSPEFLTLTTTVSP